MKNQNWYVSANVQHDTDTMLFTKRVKIENLNSFKDRTIAHVDGITLEDAEKIANAVSLIPKMITEFTYIQLHLTTVEGIRKLTNNEKVLLDRVNQMIQNLENKP
jgi:hypothetical protein